MQSNQNHARLMSLRDVAQILCRRRWIILGILLPTVIVAVVGSLLSTPIYRASAKILLKQDRFGLVHVASEVSRPLLRQQVGEQDMNSEIELLKSHALLEAVVDLHQLDQRAPCSPLQPHARWMTVIRDKFCRVRHLTWWKTPPENTPARSHKLRQDAVNELSNHLDVIPIETSNLIRVSYEDRDSALAARIVTDLIEQFRTKHVQLNQSDGAYTLYRNEAKTLRDSLVRSEEQLKTLRNQAGIIDLDKQKTLNLTKLAEFEAALRTVEADIASTREEIKRLKAQLSKLPRRIASETRLVQNSALDNLKASMMSLEVTRSRLKEKFTPDHQQLREVESQIREGKRILGEESSTQVKEQSTQLNPLYETLQQAHLQAQTTLGGLLARQQVLQQHVSDYHQLSQHLDRMSFELAPLKREAELKAKAYLSYVKKEEEARLSNAMDQHRMVNIDIAEPTYILPDPISPRRKLNVLIALLVGTITGLVMAFVADFSDHTFKTRNEIEKQLGLPWLASIPSYKQWQDA